jgi:hypothetical protein
MPIWMWIVIAALVVVAAVVLVTALAVGRRRRTERLKARFGPEYEHTVATVGGSGAAEKELIERERHHDELDIRGLSSTARHDFARQWHGVQTAFVDDPAAALGEADRLVNDVMRERGYPVEHFDQRAAEISVDHPTIVQDYRAAHDISHNQHDSEVGTEQQRQAFVHYRALFDTLLTPEHDTTTKETSS